MDLPIQVFGFALELDIDLTTQPWKVMLGIFCNEES